MLRDRYDPMDLFALVPQLSIEMDPVLVQLDHLLGDDVLFTLRLPAAHQSHERLP